MSDILAQQIEARHDLQNKLDRLIRASRRALATYELANLNGTATWTGEDVDELRAAIRNAEQAKQEPDEPDEPYYDDRHHQMKRT